MARLRIYEHLLQLNTGFQQVRNALVALSKEQQFDRSELRRFEESSEEARASINSYLANIIEGTETAAAGRLSSRRLKRERKEEAG
jgi:predicted  nucleic acid-binding Zn-ribbon protein